MFVDPSSEVGIAILFAFPAQWMVLELLKLCALSSYQRRHVLYLMGLLISIIQAPMLANIVER